MNIGTKYEYLWQDNENYPEPAPLCAKDYMDKMLTWVENLLNDENIFPTYSDVPFPDDFIVVISNIFRRLFRAYGHIYSKYFYFSFSHYDYFVSIDKSLEYNKCFKRFILISREFNLIPSRELEPLDVFFENLY